jgi:hypothetical protein
VTTSQFGQTATWLGPHELGDGLEATVEAGDEMTDDDVEDFISNRDPGDEHH